MLLVSYFPSVKHMIYTGRCAHCYNITNDFHNVSARGQRDENRYDVNVFPQKSFRLFCSTWKWRCLLG